MIYKNVLNLFFILFFIIYLFLAMLGLIAAHRLSLAVESRGSVVVAHRL